MMPEEKDFFVSYTGADNKWAEWIAWILEEADYKTMIQAWDFNAASNFVLKMHSGATGTARTVAVLTPDYFKSAFTQPEWAAAFVDDPKSEQGKLIAVRVADFEPPGLFKAIVYIDLVGLDEIAAKEKLIKSIGSIVTGQRLKPDSKPAFPGTKSATARPLFPGISIASKLFLHNLPFASNPFFMGRDKMLQDLHTALSKNAAAAITQPQAVHGLGGVGKTQLAIEYAWQHQTDYDVVLWAAASSSGELHVNIAALTDLLHLRETETKEQHIKVKAVVDWMRSHQRWLLILDNADSKEAEAAVAILLPPGLQGHILVTSRRSDWPVNFTDLEVSVLPEPAAKDFLLKRAHKPDFIPGNDAEALAVAVELGCLPLALEQAAAYIVKHRISFSEYKRSLEQSRRRLLEFPSQGGTGYQQTVATTWLVTESQLSHTAIAILQLAAFFSPFDIPREIFTNAGELLSNVAGELLKVPRGESQTKLSAEEIQDALAELHEHSLIKLEPSVFSCHRLLQAVLLDRLESPLKENWMETAIALLAAAAVNPIEPSNWPFWSRLRPQIEAFLNNTKSFPQNLALPYLMMRLAAYYEHIGAYSLGVQLMRKAIDFTIAMGASQADVINSELNLARLLSDTAQFDEAEKLCKKLIHICEENKQITDQTFANIVTVLAQTMTQRDRFEESEQLHEQALQIIENDDKSEPVNLAAAINNLAEIMTIMGRFHEGEKQFRRSLAILEEHLGKDSPAVATVVGNLAACLHEQGILNESDKFYAEAEFLYRRALSIDEAAFGNDHPLYARDANNLGRFLHERGKFDEAETLIRQSLKIEESKREKNHPAIATSLSNLGRLLTSKGNFVESQYLLKRAISICELSLGRDNHDYATYQTNLAFPLIECGKLGEGEACFRESLRIDEKCFGAKHIEVARDLWNLACHLISINKLLEAEGLLRRASNIYKNSLGKKHSRTLKALHTIETVRTARTLKNIFK